MKRSRADIPLADRHGFMHHLLRLAVLMPRKPPSFGASMTRLTDFTCRGLSNMRNSTKDVSLLPLLSHGLASSKFSPSPLPQKKQLTFAPATLLKKEAASAKHTTILRLAGQTL